VARDIRRKTNLLRNEQKIPNKQHSGWRLKPLLWLLRKIQEKGIETMPYKHCYRDLR